MCVSWRGEECRTGKQIGPEIECVPGDVCEEGRGILRSIFSGALQTLSLPSHPCSCTLGCQGDPGSQLTAKCFSRSSYRAVVLTPHSPSKSGLLLLFMVLYLVPDIMTEPGPGQALMGLRKTLKFLFPILTVLWKIFQSVNCNECFVGCNLVLDLERNFIFFSVTNYRNSLLKMKLQAFTHPHDNGKSMKSNKTALQHSRKQWK